MTIESTRPNTPTGSPERGIDRRQLLKAGAWAAPVLLVTVAAPAASASNEQGAQLIFENFTPYFSDDGAGHRTGITVNTGVRVGYDNSGPGYTGFDVGNVSLRIELPAAWFTTASTVTILAGAWTQMGTPSVSGDVVRFVFTSGQHLTTTGPLSTGNVQVNFSSNGILPPGTTISVRGIASAVNGRAAIGGPIERTVPNR